MSKPEIYASIDVETDGPVPGLNSMLSLGVAFIDAEGAPISSMGWNMTPLPDAVENSDTMAWWRTQSEAWAEVQRDRHEPWDVMAQFREEIEATGGKVIAVAWPAAFDFAFVNYYFHRFLGHNPLGFACVDMRSYAWALTRAKGYYKLPERAMKALAPGSQEGLRPHVAVDDAIEQSRLFAALLRESTASPVPPEPKP